MHQLAAIIWPGDILAVNVQQAHIGTGNDRADVALHTQARYRAPRHGDDRVGGSEPRVSVISLGASPDGKRELFFVMG